MARSAASYFDNPAINKIVSTIMNIGGGKYRRYKVFSDWVEMLAIAISNVADKSQLDVREARYMELAKSYTEEELAEFSGLTPILCDAFSSGSDGINFDDVLGSIFMACDFGSDCHGQFFTPYKISSLTARMAVGVQDAIRRLGVVRANEPACGSGGMCVALAEIMHNDGINYQQRLHITAKDIDPVCVHMAYIQLSLLHIPAVVILGNTLKMEQDQKWVTLSHVIGGWNERLRIVEFMDAVGPVFLKNGKEVASELPQSEFCFAISGRA